MQGNHPPSPPKTSRSGLSTLSDSKSERGGTSVSSGRSSARGDTASTNSSLTRAKLDMLEKMGPSKTAGPRSGAAATALASMRHPGAGTARERHGLRSGHSDTMSTISNKSTGSSASGKFLEFIIILLMLLIICLGLVVADSVISRSVARKGRI
jgi:hypothetical protein